MTKRPKIASPKWRSVAEWIGKTPDARAPAHVRLRIFDRAEGRCHISGAKIGTKDKWQLEHVISLEAGGENRESNLAPALIEPHKAKSAKEAGVRSKVRAVRIKHVGAADPPQKPIKSRGFDPPVAKDHKLKKELPPRVGGIRFVDDD